MEQTIPLLVLLEQLVVIVEIICKGSVEHIIFFNQRGRSLEHITFFIKVEQTIHLLALLEKLVVIVEIICKGSVEHITFFN